MFGVNLQYLIKPCQLIIYNVDRFNLFCLISLPVTVAIKITSLLSFVLVLRSVIKEQWLLSGAALYLSSVVIRIATHQLCMPLTLG